MTRMISAFRIVTIGAVLTGTCLAAGCGGSPATVSRTTTTEQTTSAPPPPPAVSTTTTTTEQIRQSH